MENTRDSIRSYRVIIEPDEPSGYHGFVPLLPGVHTCGETIEAVKKSLREAIKCHVQGLIKDKEPVPREGDALEFIQSFFTRELILAK